MENSKYNLALRVINFTRQIVPLVHECVIEIKEVAKRKCSTVTYGVKRPKGKKLNSTASAAHFGHDHLMYDSSTSEHGTSYKVTEVEI